MNVKKHLFYIAFTVFNMLAFHHSASSQQKVKLIKADNLLFHDKISGAQRLIGAVILEYDSTTMHCDSAWVYPEEDYFDAWGHIRINGNEALLTGDSLHIDREKNEAQVMGDVLVKDKEMTLTTTRIDYDMETKVASYYGGGNIDSQTNNNKLSSEEGFYDTASKFFHFRGNVVLNNPDYTIHSDTLKYSDPAEKAWFLGPTTIASKEGTTIYCEDGWYETKTDNSSFRDHTKISYESTVLQADSIHYDGDSQAGEMFGNVNIEDTVNNYLITGEYGKYNKTTDISYVTNRALMTQFFEKDSLFLHADTLWSKKDSLEKKYIQAYNNVKFYKSDMQGVADSLIYHETDSTLVFYNDPIIWSEENQIMGDTIRVTMKNKQADQLFIDGHAFVVSHVVQDYYNQIKGRNIVGYFKENNLNKLNVIGNVQVVYYPEDNRKGETRLIGQNKLECATLDIFLKDNQIARLKIEEKTQGKLSPLKEVLVEDKTLKGFQWLIDSRPTGVDTLFD